VAGLENYVIATGPPANFVIVDSQEFCLQLARRTAKDRHAVVIAACCVVPARRYVHVVQPGV
jgi:hypothetical protein